MKDNLINFIVELTELSEKYGIVISGNPRLNILNSEYIPSSLIYNALDKISCYGGIDKSGPFLSSTYENTPEEITEKVYGTAPALMKSMVYLNPKKHMKQDFKDRVNQIKKENYKSNLEGF
jgi:hypothetical protein